MSVFRSNSRRAVRHLRNSLFQSRLQQCRYAQRESIRVPITSPPFPTIESCPVPSCQCRETPAGLDIEREQSMNGSMAAYAEQVLISTGKPDWASRIETEADANFLRKLKSFIGPRGKYSDPYHNVMLTNSSLPPTSPSHLEYKSPARPVSTTDTLLATNQDADSGSTSQDTASSRPASVYLLPSFTYIPGIPTDTSSIEEFVRAFLLPSRLHTAHDVLNDEQKNALLRQPELRRKFPGARQADEVLVLICGHGGRDERCGILGPILQAEFEEKLERQNIPVLRDPPSMTTANERSGRDPYQPTARVGLISHIGGHKFAGNIIVYIPSAWTSHPLAGKGIWYGRVEPHHVEGIVAKTILDGRVIKDHWRGGIAQGGEILRL